MLNTDQLSYWEQKDFIRNIDFLIVGAGIVGYSTGIHLRKRFPNSKIVLLERGYLPSGASSKNAGFACFGSATELYDDLQNSDKNTVWETVEMRWKGLQYLRELIGDDHLKLQINGSWDLITEDQSDLALETRSLLPYFNDQIFQITGEQNVYAEEQDLSRFGFEGIHTSFTNRLEGQIDTASMNQRFYELAVAAGIKVLFGVEVISYETNSNSVIVDTNAGEFHAAKLFICTNGFAKSLIKDEEIAPARAQVLITKPLEKVPFEGTFHYDRGYYYFRNIDNRIMLGGGRNMDFKGETTTEMINTEQIMDRLKHLLRAVIAPNTPIEIDHQWAGIMGVGVTKRPIIKSVDQNVYCGVRLGGMGVAIGTLVGKELSEMV